MPVVANIIAWFDASDSATLFADTGTTPSSVNGIVRQWNDKSGNLNHLRASADSVSPVLHNSASGGRPGNTLNNKNAIYFDGVDDRLLSISNITDSLTSNEVSVFAVVAYTASSPITSTALVLGNTSQRYMSLRHATTVGAGGVLRGADVVTTSISDAVTARTGNRLLSSHFRAASKDIFVNGLSFSGSSVAHSTTAGLSGNTTNKTLKVGTGSSSDSASNLMLGYIAEVLVYSQGMTETDRTSVTNYLKAKWGVS